VESISKKFSRVRKNVIAAMEGHHYYWLKKPNENLRLLARQFSEELTEICSIVVPNNWVGCGHWVIYWPVGDNDKSRDDLLISFSIASDNPGLIENYDPTKIDAQLKSAFLAAIHLSPQNTDIFYDFAETNYMNIR
jgi:hypothetical protein